MQAPANDSSSTSSSKEVHEPEIDLTSRLRELRLLVEKLVLNDSEIVHSLCDALNELSTILAKSERDRRRVGQEVDPPIWPTLDILWATLAESSENADEMEASICALAEAVGKLTRNLVAAVPANQQRALKNEKYIRTFLYRYTSFWATEDLRYLTLVRMLVQALVNIATQNEETAYELWHLYMNLPQEQSILIRLLQSPDTRVVLSTLVLILNCIHGSEERTRLLLTGINGRRTSVALLDRIDKLFDSEESSEGGRAFGIGYEIVVRLIESTLAPELYAMLSTNEETVSPLQITVLKILDAYLQAPITATSTDALVLGSAGLLRMLLSIFADLSSYAQRAMRRSVGPEKIATTAPTVPGHDDGAQQNLRETASTAPLDPPLELDVMLPKVCEALILVAQCITSIALSAESARDRGPRPQKTRLPPTSAKLAMNSFVSPQGMTLAEDVVETLRLLDVFLPRITFGKAVPRQTPLDPSSNGASAENLANAEKTHANIPYIKRDLVRLLGILCADDKTVQDQVRGRGGVPVIMNLCVVDDQNPYLREHAIFALRNLLHDNPENQAIVEQFQPVGRWDADRVLQNIDDEQFS